MEHGRPHAKRGRGLPGRGSPPRVESAAGSQSVAPSNGDMRRFRFALCHIFAALLAVGAPARVRAEGTLDPALVEQLLRREGAAPVTAPAEPVPIPLAEPEGLFALYEQNRRDDRAHYITVDLLLVSYSLIRQTTQAEFERDRLRPLLIQWLSGLARCLPSDKALVTAANRDFLAVASTLLANDAAPAGLSERARAEWRLVDQALGPAPSPLWEIPLDYGQFKPRGPYTASPEAAVTFRGLRYLSAILFPLQPSPAIQVGPTLGDRLLAQYRQLAEALSTDAALVRMTQNLEQALAWSQGPADDLVFADWQRLPPPTSPVETVHELRQRALVYAQTHHRQPRILGQAVRLDQLLPDQTAAHALTGWRLLPQRITAESAAFQELIQPGTGRYQHHCATCTPFGLDHGGFKGYPALDELPALLGSALAAQGLAAAGETDFAGYPDAAQRAGDRLNEAVGLNALHLNLMRQGLAASAAADPEAQHRVDSLLGFWIWQRYLGVLYQKTSTTPLNKDLPAPRPGAWIEPAPPLYRALIELVAAHQRHTPNPRWDRFKPLLERCLAIAQRALKTGRISAEDEAFLNDLDLPLRDLAGQDDAPIVIDLHAHPTDGQVMEIALRYPRVVCREGSAQPEACGGRFAPVAFKQPLAERLDDPRWQERLRREAATPTSPSTTRALSVDTPSEITHEHPAAR